MRHQKKRHKLGRTASHRKATLAALGNSLITHKRITTTVPKAKALRGFIEPLITRAKEDTTHNRRQVFRRLQDNRAVSTLFDEVSAQVGDRPGGYTRVIKLGRRSGDGAPLAMIELVDYNDVQPETSGGAKKRRTRRGGGSGRRRGRSKGATTTEAKQTATASATTKQVDTKSKGVDSEPIEEPISEDQATPVTERTDAGEVPEEQVEAAEETVKEKKSEAGKADASTEASDTDASDTDASDTEAADTEAADTEAADTDAAKDEVEPAEASAEQGQDSAESGDETDEESAADETKKNE